MKAFLPLLLFMIVGCQAPGQTYTPAETPLAYFDSLPTVTIPKNPYADEEQAHWFSIGYREGWQRGSAGVNAHPDPWYPQHRQCVTYPNLRQAHVAGFDAGFDAGFTLAQDRLAEVIHSLGKVGNREPDGAANGSQPFRSQ